MTEIEPEHDNKRNRRHWITRWLTRFVVFTAMAYVVFLITLSFSETALVYPGSDYPKGNWDPDWFEYEEIEFQSADGTDLVGWFIPTDQEPAEPTRTILICHGNAENVAEVSGYWGTQFRDRLRAQVFAFDYRGYGKCKGTPNEEGLFQDSVAALNVLCEKANCQPEDVIIVGHSLGGGPAVHLAKTEGCKMLVLQRTYSSLPDAAAASYPMFPVHWIMKNRMNSADSIRDCVQPLFQSHGSEDALIPVELGHKLHENSPAESKEFFEVEGMGHWDPLPEEYWQRLSSFVDDVCG
ncbi:MAG: alpha/beta hydrolase [Planctomycetota bacterium]